MKVKFRQAEQELSIDFRLMGGFIQDLSRFARLLGLQVIEEEILVPASDSGSFFMAVLLAAMALSILPSWE